MIIMIRLELEEEGEDYVEGDAMPALVTLTLTMLAPSIPLKVKLEDRELSASLGFVTPVPLISTLTTVELTPCVIDISLEVF